MNPETPTKLKFVNGKFRIEAASAKTRLRLSKDPNWGVASGFAYETIHLRAAAAFRTFADGIAEKILNRAFQAHYDLPGLPPLPLLDDHQRAGLEWVLQRKRSYLAHAPGAGKTAVAILAACFAQGPGQAVFIVPPSLVTNWERETLRFTEWAGVWPAIGIIGRSDDQAAVAWRADFLIVPDSMLTKPWVYERLRAMKKKFIAVDEASRFKEPAAERSLAFYGGRNEAVSYPGLYQRARHVVFLDGSPMPNRPIELWAPTFALHPEAIDCMDRDDFGYRYCGAKPNERGVWEYNWSSHEAELREKLRRDFMHVVTEEELPHPERLRSMLYLNADLRTPEMKTWEKRHLGKLLESEIDEDAGQGEVAALRRELGVSKIPGIAAYARERLVGKDESVLLFAWHRDVCEGLVEKLSKFNPGLVMGGTSGASRERDFDHFQRGKKKLLVINIAAGARGHNLQAANRVIFGEYSWTDETNRQCEHRAARRGSEQMFVRCDYIVSPGSFDERVLASIFTKQKRVKRIIG